MFFQVKREKNVCKDREQVIYLLLVFSVRLHLYLYLSVLTPPLFLCLLSVKKNKIK